MELIRGIHNIRDAHRRCVLTIGNFDGVHLGHQAILRRVNELAHLYRVPSCVMIFEPQPREFFATDTRPARITRLRDKIRLLQAQGIDYVLCLPFNQKLQQLDAQAFCQHILADGLMVRHLVVGDDFRFGCDRQGDFAYLNLFGRMRGFVVENTRSILTAKHERISSTLVRDCLEQGDIVGAEHALGHPILITGRVIHGQKLARTLGFPTANIYLKMAKPALSGVFAVTLSVLNAAGRPQYKGVANIGVRPTVQGSVPILEVHLFDFDGDLYNQYVAVRFCYFIRAERKMSGLAELEQQILWDKTVAVDYFIREPMIFEDKSKNHE